MKAIDIAKGKIRLKNRNLFTNLNAYNYQWELYKNGELLKKQNISVNGKPLSEAEITIPLPSLEFGKGVEYFLRLKALTKTATDLIPAGHEVAAEEFAFPENQFFAQSNPEGQLKITQTDKDLQFESGDVKGRISLKSGQLEEYTCNGKQLLRSAPVPNFWRAPIDNDFGNKIYHTSNFWRNAGDFLMQVKQVDVKKQTNEGVEVVVSLQIRYLNIPYTAIYQVRNDGSVKISARIDMKGIDHPELLRFGMKMQIPKQFENVSYYGKGPWENYNDRNRSAFVGNYACKVKDLGFDYIRPQENGYRTEIRTVSFTGDEGFGIKLEGFDAPVCFNARYNADEDLDPGLTKKQQHPIDISPRLNAIYVNIDLKQLGVGGDDSWGARPMKQYRMLDDVYDYSYVIKPAK
jgi:beta-galactosidase